MEGKGVPETAAEKVGRGDEKKQVAMGTEWRLGWSSGEWFECRFGPANEGADFPRFVHLMPSRVPQRILAIMNADHYAKWRIWADHHFIMTYVGGRLFYCDIPNPPPVMGDRPALRGIRLFGCWETATLPSDPTVLVLTRFLPLASLP